ncbi:hypothetical protein ILUMI_20219 [Ignelater luminosus]|uniref:Uncharacterized protein n=1 Tax=Ignelater luminosus TaxID=2038154 RepID=A0A8K0CLC7_IGNLU|nr:hypothetical protein ILUMI_20219 [Ignelater luminosus]
MKGNSSKNKRKSNESAKPSTSNVIDATDSDEEISFSNWLRTADGIELMKLFVVMNSLIVFLTMMWNLIDEHFNQEFRKYLTGELSKKNDKSKETRAEDSHQEMRDKMVRNYKHKTDREKTLPGSIPTSCQRNIQRGTSFRQASEAYNLNFITLFRYVIKLKCRMPNLKIKASYATPRQIFFDIQENELVEYIRHSAKIFFGLTTTDAKSLANE